MNDYKQLQNLIDKVIGRIGLEKTILLLDSFINTSSIQGQNTNKILSQQIISLVIETFGLIEKELLTNNTRDYRDARFCCFHLLRKYSHYTFAKIALFFNITSRMVEYGHKVVEERLAFPKFNIEFSANYKLIESKLIIAYSKNGLP